jgi:uncharacterized protein YkwD
MQKILHIQGEYRCKEGRNNCVIKDFDTKLTVEVEPGATYQYLAKKDKRLYKHLRQTLDLNCASVRSFTVLTASDSVKVEEGLKFSDVPTMKRADLLNYIEQEELPIDHKHFNSVTQLRQAIVNFVNGNRAANGVATLQAADKLEEIEHVDFLELDDRGLPVNSKNILD